MSEVFLWVLALISSLLVLDRLLLRIETRGWIRYRRSKLGRGAGTYHLLQWTSVLDPTQRQVQEERVKEERREDESGDPLGPPGSFRTGEEGQDVH